MRLIDIQTYLRQLQIARRATSPPHGLIGTLLDDGRLRTNIGNVSTLDDAVAAFNPLCACPIPNASRLASQAR